MLMKCHDGKELYFTIDSISHNNKSGRGANLNTIRSKQDSGLCLYFGGYL